MPKKKKSEPEKKIQAEKKSEIEKKSHQEIEKTSRKSTKDERLFQNLLKVTYEFITGKRYAPLSRGSLIERLRIHPDHFAIFDQVLKNLKEAGKLDETQDKYHSKSTADSSSKTKTVVGSLKVHPRGFGFLEIPDSDEADVFIPKPYINRAIDGDIVEVAVNLESVSEKGPEGKVLSVVSRKRKAIVGTVSSVNASQALVFCPLLGDKNPAILHQPSKKDQDKLVVGDRVQLEVTDWGSKEESIKTKLLRKIGHISDPATDIPAAILENEIREAFPEEAVAEAKAYGTKVTKKDLEGREDLRKLECFTIDPDTAKDYDDAISLTEENGLYVLGVHIADVSHYVKPNSALDREAHQRCNSTYFPGYCVPMLPHELSDNLCSLREGVMRLTVSVFMHVDKDGELISWRIARSVIKSSKRFTYKQVKKILDDELESPHKKKLQQMVSFCHILKKKRASRGSVQLYMPELFVHVDPTGKPTGTEIIEYDITHQMVEEFMLKANEVVAIHLSKEGKNVTFRVHEEPARESLREFAALVSAFGYQLAQDPTPQDIQKFFTEIESSPYAQYLATCYIRSMRLACYSPDNIGHYGLSLEHYCHFTSPIRRYVDTVVHRLLFGENEERSTLAAICQEASDKERISGKAEGSVIMLKKLRLLQEICQKHHHKQFEAVITRIKPFGIYFDILELMLEGFLHISELDNDYFIYNETAMHLFGRHTQVCYKAGDSLLVMAKSIDFITPECTWEFVAHTSQEKPKMEIAPYSKPKAMASLPKKSKKRFSKDQKEKPHVRRKH